MHQELKAQASELEREVLRGVFSVPENSYDGSRSFVSERGGFLLCRFVSERDAHCPFELHFGRGRHSSYFNFFVGAGAEFANLESLASPKDALELGDDVQRFMTSQVRCERQVNSGQVVREDYYVSEIDIALHRELRRGRGDAPSIVNSPHRLGKIPDFSGADRRVRARLAGMSVAQMLAVPIRGGVDNASVR
jgi:hypothetical protein